MFCQVLLRSEFRDEPVMLLPEEVAHLEDPPEKKWTEMTAKDAVEALLVKDPGNAILKSLRKSGKLQEILYADEEGNSNGDNYRSGSSGDFKNKKYMEEKQGREGGARIRSISTANTAAASTTRKEWKPKDVFWDSSNNNNQYTATTANNNNRGRSDSNNDSYSTVKSAWGKRDSSSSFSSSSPSAGGSTATGVSDDSSMDDWLNDLLGATTTTTTASNIDDNNNNNNNNNAFMNNNKNNKSGADGDYER